MRSLNLVNLKNCETMPALNLALNLGLNLSFEKRGQGFQNCLYLNLNFFNLEPNLNFKNSKKAAR